MSDRFHIVTVDPEWDEDDDQYPQLTTSIVDWPTDPKEALKLSIEKWQFLVDNIPTLGWIEDGGIITCACCRRTIAIAGNDILDCDLCPIGTYKKEQGEDHYGCMGTPYARYQGFLVEDPKWQAQDELDFLKEVLASLEGKDG